MRPDRVGAAVLVGQDQHAFVLYRIEVPVPDEVQHVPLLAKQQILQVGPDRRRRPGDLDEAVGDRLGQRPRQQVTFPGDVQRGQAARRGDDSEEPQRRADRERRRHRGDVDVPHELVLQAHVTVGQPVVHGLPRQPGQLGAVDAQAQPQAVLAQLRDRRRRTVPAADVAGPEQRAEQRLAHVPDRLLDLGQVPARGHRRRQQRVLHFPAPGQQRGGVKRDLRRRLASRRPQHLYLEQAVPGSPADRDLDDAPRIVARARHRPLIHHR